jgi:hypothetical protein
MDAAKISFCNHNGYSIQNNRIKSNIIKKINKRYKYDIYTMDFKIYSDHLQDVLKKNKYLTCCLMTTGRPYMMYFTKILNEKVCLMIDLKVRQDQYPNIIVVTISATDQVYNETLIIGDLFKNNKNYKWEFHVEKCIIYNARYIKTPNQITNLKICNDILKQISPNIFTPFNMKLKDFSAISKLPELINKYNQQTIGFKIYGMRTPVMYYLNKKYIPRNKILPIKLINYNGTTQFDNEKNKIKKTFSLSSHNDTNDSDIWCNIIENNIDIEREFILTLKKSNTYGIFHIHSNNEFIGISRITTIELQNEISNLFKTKTYLKIKAYYNFNFNKWNIENIVDIQLKDDNLKDIKQHIQFISQIPKPNYVLQNC